MLGDLDCTSKRVARVCQHQLTAELVLHNLKELEPMFIIFGIHYCDVLCLQYTIQTCLFHFPLMPSLRNDLYCVEWDVKPTIPYHTLNA